MIRTALYISIALLSAMVTGCSSNSVIDSEDPEPTDVTPLRFSSSSVGNMETRLARASQALTSDFLVSTYKAYKTGNQQTVMEQYQALYQPDGWSGTGAKWNTVGGTGDGFYQNPIREILGSLCLPLRIHRYRSSSYPRQCCHDRLYRDRPTTQDKAKPLHPDCNRRRGNPCIY